ncbi:nuclear pore protein-like protein [Apiospora saccharicola]|uniref:Nuclear pore protein-like protein n=1 Tax=Apiospora saccharicola TaxID=335842 RepID=A0ABR1W436_9PEZI
MEEPGVKCTEVVLVKDSDLVIKICGETWKYFRADSRIVSRSSEKWRQLVDDSRTYKRSISLLGDPKYHGLALSIMHGKFEDVPTYLTKDELFDLISVTEHQGVTYQLRPWASVWLKHHQELPDSIPQTDIDAFLVQLKRSIIISWVFGEKERFRKLTKFFIEEITLNEGTNVFLGNVDVWDMRDISGYLDYLKKEHQEKVRNFRDVFETAIEQKCICYSRRSDEHGLDDVNVDNNRDRGHCECECGEHSLDGQFCRLCIRPASEQAMCNSIIIGSMLRGYQKQKPKPVVHRESTQSISAVFRQLLAIDIYNFPKISGPGIPTQFGGTHDICNPHSQIRQQLLEIMASIAKNLPKNFQRHLDRRAKLTGLNGQPKEGWSSAPNKTG